MDQIKKGKAIGEHKEACNATKVSLNINTLKPKSES